MRLGWWLGPAGLAAVCGVLVGACGSDDGGGNGSNGGYCEQTPAGSHLNGEIGCDQRCPGDPGCEPGGDPTFLAGAAVADITPVVDHVVAFSEFNQNKTEFAPEYGDKCVEKASCNLADPKSCPAVDPMKCTWIAGFGSGRPATGNADPSTVRCVVMQQAETKIGLCAIDAVGWFYNEVEETRKLIAEEYPELDLDYVGVAATHVHETQDTMGIWGPTDSESGSKPEYNALIRQKTAEALAAANAALEPVTLELGKSIVDGHIPGTDPGGHKAAAFVSDTRDPVVIDLELRTIRFVAKDDEATVATLINFTSHPEFGGDENLLTSSDFVHTLREGVEKGLDLPTSPPLHEPGLGGVAIFFNGALGGQVGPGEVRHLDHSGAELPDGLERAYVNGERLAAYAHEAMTEGVQRLETAPLGFRARELYVDVRNNAYHIAIVQQLFHREGYFYDPGRQLGDDNYPAIRTQIVVIDIGPAEMVSVPGELHTELLLATPEGTTALDPPYPFTPEPYFVLNDPATNPSCGQDGYSRCDDGPPDITKMDRSKVIDLARDPKAEYRWVLGLGLDEIGYIVPEYDYVLDAQNPYFEEASPGNHYEEPNSVGYDVEQLIVDPILQLLRSPKVIER